MGAKTSIEWVRGADGVDGSSWTPIRASVTEITAGGPRTRAGWHCTHMTEACRNCYAESINKRLGTGLAFKPGHEKQIELYLDERMLRQPLAWQKPRTIFVCSMTDLFGDFVPDAWIYRMLGVAEVARQHRYMVLTKRHGRMRRYFTERDRDPLPNLWIGGSAHDQESFGAMADDVLQTPAAVRFASLEPLLGPIDVSAQPGFDLLIAGGESGPNARPNHLEWTEGLIRQCAGTGTALFHKQAGARPWWRGQPLKLRDRKGGDPQEWPEALRVRDMPR